MKSYYVINTVIEIRKGSRHCALYIVIAQWRRYCVKFDSVKLAILLIQDYLKVRFFKMSKIDQFTKKVKQPLIGDYKTTVLISCPCQFNKNGSNFKDKADVLHTSLLPNL